MYFRNVICTVALATLASAAVAKQIPTDYPSDSFEEDDSTNDIYVRDAEPDAARTAVWEAAHGGKAPNYKFGESHDAAAWHVVREAEAEAQPEPRYKPANWASWLSSALPPGVKKVLPTGLPAAVKPKVGVLPYRPNYARDVEDEGEDEQFDDEDPELFARDAEDDEVPDFGDEDVDVSLEGYDEPLEERDVEAGDGESDEENYEEDSDYSLDGYDVEDEVLERRGADDEGEEDVDYSLEGYDISDEELYSHLGARDVEDDPIPDFGDEEVDTSLDGYDDLEARDVEHDESPEIDDEEGEDSEEEYDDLQVRDAGDDEIPDFGDEEVDTSLEGYDQPLEVRSLDEDDDEIPDFGDEEVDISLEGYDQPLEVRSLDEDEDEVPDFGDEEVDTSLEGYDQPLEVRDLDVEDDIYDEDYEDADAAYEDEPVVDEMRAPVLEARDADTPPTRTGGKPVSSSRGFFKFLWS